MKVIGVSPDPVKKVKRFHDKRDLNFTLLADEDHAVCDLYGVWVQKSMYGRTYMGAQRATFIIDAEAASCTSSRRPRRRRTTATAASIGRLDRVRYRAADGATGHELAAHGAAHLDDDA